METQTIYYIPPAAQASGAIRVAAYARVSSDSSDQLESYAAQVQHYEQLIRKNPNWELVDIYADEGLTGTRADTRTEFQRMLKDCRRGRIDKVLTKSISRFARNTRDTLISIRELKALGVEVFFEKERIDTGAVTSEMLISFYGSMAQEESFSISSNMRMSYQQRMKRGEFITCHAPYGYRLKGSNALEIDEIEAEIVRHIFKGYLAGNGSNAIAKALNELGIPTRVHGNEWNATSVRYILKNEKYYGDALVAKSYLTNDFPFMRKPNNGEVKQYYVTNTHPPIISKEQFQKVQQLMKQRANENLAPQQYALSKRIWCDNCGRIFRRKTSSGGDTYWTCRGHNEDKHKCPIKPLPQAAIESSFVHLWNILKEYRHEIFTPMLEQLTTLRQRAVFQQGRIAEIDNEILNIGRQAMLLHRLYGAGHMEAVHYYEQTQGLNNQVNILRRERQRIIDDQRDDNIVERTQGILDALKDGPEALLDFEGKYFDSIVNCIRIQNHTELTFELRNGLCLTERI